VKMDPTVTCTRLVLMVIPPEKVLLLLFRTSSLAVLLKSTANRASGTVDDHAGISTGSAGVLDGES